MSVKIIAKSDWASYFSRLHKEVAGKEIKIEVIGVTLGDQVLVKSAPLLGAAYEAKHDTLEFLVKGMTHVVEKPQKVSVQEDNGKMFAIEVVDCDERHQLLTFA
ncbi:DUF5335 family protein [Rhizobium cauense]|uniref:DUF5335 family protein n=1 Tax=Rhizobium cauense TaxID=1166683 RepID=UPI001C6E9E64|nr:DUF5335 family protein [Rhizobium cauense]MBW9114743.1 DUF5335 family protein [Rhizobium cauense]